MAESTGAEIWYRYEDVAYAAFADPETGEARGLGSIEIELRRFRVVKRTPKGVWITPDPGAFGLLDDDRRFVLRDARKQYACPSIEAARISFVARKRAQIRIYEARAERARRALGRFAPEALPAKRRGLGLGLALSA